jgi:poly-gamma-glutamate synthesis protein (capsule biosynthesis protein)
MGKAPFHFGVLVAVLIVAAGAVFAGGAVFGNDVASGGTDPGGSALPAASTSQTPTPTTTPEPPAPKGTLVIHGTGDVSLDPGYISTYANYGYGYAWSGLGGLFRRDDLTVVNVECPVTDEGVQIPKEFSFHGSPDALPAMADAGVEVGSLGNNHAYDRGPAGLLDSVRNLRQAGIAPVGAGANQEAALKPAMFDLQGWRVAVLGFDEVLDPLYAVAGPHKPGTAAGHDFSLMVEAVKAAADRADIVVVMIHWGVELDTQPRDYQVSEGHRLIDAGADVIFGAHSHRLQPMSTYKGRPIFWSLGNFVWPNFSVEGSTTAVAQVTVTPKGRFIGKLLPAYITAPGHPVLSS